MTVTTRVAAFGDGARLLMPPYEYIKEQKWLQCPESGSLRRTFWACTLRGTALVYQTPAAPGFTPAGFHPQASDPRTVGRIAQ